MASGRMLQKRISNNEAIADVARQLDEAMSFGHGGYAALLFTWAIAHQDVEGRIDGDARIVRGKVFPMLEWITSQHVTCYLMALGRAGLLVWYEVGGKRYIHFPGFDGAQPGLRKDREAPSVIPSPEGARILAGHDTVAAGVTPALLPASSDIAPALKSESGSLKSEDLSPSRATPLDQLWLAATGVMPGSNLLEAFDLARRAAPAKGLTPEEYFSKALGAFSSWVDGVRGARRPQKSPLKFIEHFARIQEILDGKREAVPAETPLPTRALGPIPPMPAALEDKTEVLPP